MASNEATIIKKTGNRVYKKVFSLPQMKTIFEIKSSPFDTDPRIEEWVEQVFNFSLINKARYGKIKGATLYTSYFYSDCCDIKRYEHLVKIIQLFFVLDDHTECGWGDARRNIAMTRQIWNDAILALDKVADPSLEISMTAWKPYVVYWYIVNKDICKGFQKDSKERFLGYMKDYCKANILESEKLEDNSFKDMEEMIKIRRDSIANYTLYALAEYSENLSVSDDEWNDPEFQNFLMMATDATIYRNDIISFENEWLDQNENLGKMYNVVARMALNDFGEKASKADIEMTMERVATLFGDTEKKMNESLQKLKEKQLSKQMETIIDRVAKMIGGHFHVGDIFFERYHKLYE